MSKWWKGHTEKRENGDVELVKDKELELNMPEYDEDGDIVQVEVPVSNPANGDILSAYKLLTEEEYEYLSSLATKKAPSEWKEPKGKR